MTKKHQSSDANEVDNPTDRKQKYCDQMMHYHFPKVRTTHIQNKSAKTSGINDKVEKVKVT